MRGQNGFPLSYYVRQSPEKRPNLYKAAIFSVSRCGGGGGVHEQADGKRRRLGRRRWAFLEAEYFLV